MAQVAAETRAAPASLDVEALVEAARAQTGAAPDEPFDYLDALEALVSSVASEARLTPWGTRQAAEGLVASLAVQVDVRRALERHPEIAEGVAARPVFVSGLPRTGTTLVHNLLDQHPQVRCPHFWELIAPAGSRDPREHARLAAAAQAWLDDYHAKAPRLPAIHPMEAHRPDECHRLLANAFQTLIYSARYRVPSYSAWLMPHDVTEAFRFHRVQLACILWRLPAKVVGLKCPFHLWHLEPLRAVYPEAKLVILHRDPVSAVPSLCSLCAVIMAARSDEVDKREVGAFWLAAVERAVEDLLRRREQLGGDVLHVRYPDLVGDPIGTMRRLLEFAEVPWTRPAEDAMRRWLAENPSNKHGVHTYTAEEFGLDATDLAERFAVYRETFGLS
jgi:Sulfotransferase family